MALCDYCNNPVLLDGQPCRECYAVTANVPLNVPLIAEKIGVDESQWAGNCHGISLAFVNRFGRLPGQELPGARVRRGWRQGYGGQHSWVELDRGIIVDPTWTALMGEPVRVLVTKPPGFVYDPCGWHGIHGEVRVRSAPDVGDTNRELVQWDFFGSAAYVADLLGLYADYWGDGDGWITMSVEQVHWLATLPVLPKEGRRNLSSFFAAEVYEAIRDSGHKALIPMDAWHYVMDEPYPGELPR